MDKIRDYFTEHDKFAANNGIKLVSVSEGQATAEMEIQEIHMNSACVVHGGAIFTLADLAFAAASNAYGTIALAINASINYIRAARTGKLTARATEVSKHPKLGTYQVDITDEEGQIIATFQGLAYRKRDELPFRGCS